jgi:hypothetical protein
MKELMAFYQRCNPAPFVDPAKELTASNQERSPTKDGDIIQPQQPQSCEQPRPGRPSDLLRPNSSKNVAQFIARTPGLETRLYADRKNAVWEISHELCGTQEHQRPDKNIAQFIGRHYPMRQASKRPKRRGRNEDR